MTSHTMPVARAGASASLVQVKPLTQVGFAFIDNLRILLVVLVILHHLAVTYGGEGSWYYYEGQADPLTSMLLTLFVVFNQAFFMGFYFLIAGYFVPRSLERAGSARYSCWRKPTYLPRQRRDRVRRLGRGYFKNQAHSRRLYA